MPTPNDLNNQVGSVPWTNGKRLITGATISGLFATVIAIFSTMGSWDSNGDYSPKGNGSALTGITAAQTGAVPITGGTMTGPLNVASGVNSYSFANLNSVSLPPGFPTAVGPLAVGADNAQRVWAPGYDEFFPSGNGVSAMSQEYLHSPAQLPANPYGAIYGRRAYSLLGQFSPSWGSLASDFLNANVYSGYSNGPGNTFNCTATNGSAVLTNCTLASDSSKGPVSTNPATGAAYLFFPTVVTGGSLDPSGVPLKAADATTMTMTTPGTFDDQNQPYLYPGSTGQIAVKAVSGISEINLLSHHIYALGPTPGVAYYNELNTHCSKSYNASDVDSFCNGLLININKQAPGNTHDILHHGSSGLTISNPNSGWPLDAMLSIGGWTGPYGSGDDPRDQLGAFVGVEIGTSYSPYNNTDSRSWIRTGIHIHDYDAAAIAIDTPMTSHSTFSGNAITSAPGAGNWRAGDNLYVGGDLHLSGFAGIKAPSLDDNSSLAVSSAWVRQFANSVGRTAVSTQTQSFSFDISMQVVLAGSRGTPLAGPVVGTLPACTSSFKGKGFILKKRDSSPYDVSMAASGSDTIDGASIALAGVPGAGSQNQNATISGLCDGAGSWERGVTP